MRDNLTVAEKLVEKGLAVYHTNEIIKGETMNKFERLIELNKEFEGMLVEDKTSYIWFEEDWVISWSEDNCRTSLMQGDGDSYSTDISAVVTQDDDYVLFFLDGDFGSYYLALFSKNNKVVF